MTRRSEMLEILFQAAAEPIGLLIQTDDLEATRASLYAAKYQSKEPCFEDLQIRVSPWPDGQLVICHRTVLVPAPAQSRKALPSE